MRTTELQNEINHLVFMYFTSIGVIQRDSGQSDICVKMNDLIGEIRRCREKIRELMCEHTVEEHIRDDYSKIIADGKDFVEDGMCFLDAIM
ncbi:hypothetical protein CWI42_070240 [Ordospora colligata]|uniref:Uncharacterized protein n=1 Tax=Ordospora colligata OC4 TaxID=1354746 RepID=A0A0B2UJD3_9MICR|nr:uncharacterized protein M896_070240 [Ordospora colligata OC4]KHN69458.1 hypothetical protein M896_070240 [Ordospora colligata OC4]TBU15202.1 hypothetical protein CWI41_070240 [Ordospora colligata]TBU15273.1 hypothetical protein CWI40_070240 [Ordospora colligata]TBU18455.1 hypothetical protein CWI42_070240 [Ordospora colligata]